MITRRGFGLLEVVVASAIVSVSLVMLLTVSRNFIVIAREQLKVVRAVFLVEEGFEAVRALRNESWTTYIAPLANDTSYGVAWASTTWRSTSSPQVIDGELTRSIRFSPVYRDSNSDIKPTGTLDTNTRKVTVLVTWEGNSTTSSRSLETYITNYFGN